MPHEMQAKMKIKAQSILEYIVLVGIIAAALTAMQFYFRRAIQAAVKVAADEIGSQKEGAVDYDYKYEWKWKGRAYTATDTSGTSTANQMEKGAVSYEKNETTTQSGILSWGLWQKRE